MTGKRFRVQDEPAKVTPAHPADQLPLREREQRRDDVQDYLGLSGALEVAKVNDWSADDDVRTDAVSTVEWQASGWLARWMIARTGNRLVVRGLQLEALDRSTPPGGITADLLRSLSPARAVAAAADTSGMSPALQIIQRWTNRERDQRGPSTQQPDRRPGRPRIDDDELAAVALAYLEELDAGAGLRDRIAHRFHMQPSTVRDRIRMCRERGFLTDTERGRRGAEAGPQLQVWLSQHGIATTEGETS